MQQLHLFNPPVSSIPSIPSPTQDPADDQCVIDIYNSAIDGYNSQDADMMACCLNEIALLCAKYFQLRDPHNN